MAVATAWEGHALDSTAYAEWEVEERTAVEPETLTRLIRAAVKHELRPLVWLLVAVTAICIGLAVALAFTLWAPG